MQTNYMHHPNIRTVQNWDRFFIPIGTDVGWGYSDLVIGQVKGTQTEDMVGDYILFSCECLDIGVPGGMDGGIVAPW